MTLAELDDWSAVETVEHRWLDVQQSMADPLYEYKLAPWQPLPHEGRAFFVAFRSYLTSSDRDVRMVAAVIHWDFSKTQNVAKAFEWERRAELYDQWSDRQADHARAEAMQSVAVDTARAFAKLPDLISKAHTLVEGSLNAELQKIAAAAAEGTEVEHIGLTQAMKLTDSLRGLLSETNRFLGTTINVHVEGEAKHTHLHAHANASDLEAFVQGLGEANLIPEAKPKRPKAIEVRESDVVPQHQDGVG